MTDNELIAVTGMGVSCSVAENYNELTKLMETPSQQLGSIPYGEAPRGKYHFSLNSLPPSSHQNRCSLMSHTVLNEAISMDPDFGVNQNKTGLLIATCWGDTEDLEKQYDEFMRGFQEAPGEKLPKQLKSAALTYPLGSIGDNLCKTYELTGPRGVISNACASGNIAIGAARDILLTGQCDAMVVIGVERFTLSGVWGAERSGFVGRKLKPFDANRDGTVLGEGAACLILRRAKDASTPRAFVESWAMTCEEGADIIALKADGAAIEESMNRAIARAGRSPNEIDIISAHAPGTLAIDALETKAVARIWPEQSPLVNSLKSMTGHMSGASAITEAVACIAQLETGIVHGNYGLEKQDPIIPIKVVSTNSVSTNANIALSNACGGGGLNTSIVLSSPRAEKPRHASPPPEPIKVAITAMDFLQAPNTKPLPNCSDWYDIKDWFHAEEKISYMNRSGQLGAIAGIKAIEASKLLTASPEIAPCTAIISGSWIAGWPTASVAFCEGLRKSPVEIFPSTAFDNGCHLGSIILSRRYGFTGMTTTYCGDLASGGMALFAADNAVSAGYVKAAVSLAYDVTHETIAHLATAEKNITSLEKFTDGASAAVLEPLQDAEHRGSKILGIISGKLGFSHNLLRKQAVQSAASEIANHFRNCDISEVCVAAPWDQSLKKFGSTVAQMIGANLDWDNSQSHIAAAQFMAVIARKLPSKDTTLFITGTASGSKLAVAISPYIVSHKQG